MILAFGGQKVVLLGEGHGKNVIKGKLEQIHNLLRAVNAHMPQFSFVEFRDTHVKLSVY